MTYNVKKGCYLFFLKWFLLLQFINSSNAFVPIQLKKVFYISTDNNGHSVFVLTQRRRHEQHQKRPSEIKNRHFNSNAAINNIRGGGGAGILTTPSHQPKKLSLLFSFFTLFYALSFKFLPLQAMSSFFGTVIEKDGIDRFIVQLMGTNLLSLASTSYHGAREKLSTEKCIAKGLQKRCIFFAIAMITDRARGLGINYKPLLMLEAFYALGTYFLLSSSISDELKSLCAKLVAAFSTIIGSVLLFNPNSFLNVFGVVLETQLAKDLGKIASCVVLLNGLYLTSLVSNKFNPVQAVGIVSFASIPVLFQFQAFAGFSFISSIVASVALASIGTVTLFGKNIENDS